MCPLAGMSADVPGNPAVGLLWISSRLQGMGIPFPVTALPGRRRGQDAFSLLPSHRLEPEGVCGCVLSGKLYKYSHFIHHSIGALCYLANNLSSRMFEKLNKSMHENLLVIFMLE